MKIKDLPEMEKPYEKLENYGAERLSDAEVLAIILRNGTTEMTVVELAQTILLMDKEHKGLSFLKDLTIDELRTIKGIGRVKAIQIKAALEFSNRVSKPQSIIRQVIRSAEDVAEMLMDDMKDEKQEIIKTILLNTQNQVIMIITNAIGNINSSSVEVRDIFKEPIKYNAPKIILVHNHPSGNPSPSDSDVYFTRKIYDAGETFGIEVLDHVIIGDGCFKSLKRMNKF